MLLLCCVAFSQDAPPNDPTQPATPDQRGTDQVPFAVKVLPTPDAKEQADKAEHDRKEKAVIDEKIAFETQRIADYTDRLAWFTLMLFGIAVMQAGLFVWQLLLIKGGTKDTRATAEAARTQATAAERQLRAYVFPKEPKIVGLFDQDGITMTCKLQNFGQTPAYGLVCTATSYIGPVAQGTVIVPGSIGPVSQLDLGPGASITITEKHRALSNEEKTDINEGKKAIYFSGNALTATLSRKTRLGRSI